MTKPGSCSIWNIYPKKSNSDKLIFCVLIFITVNLVICTCYSVYREKYAINQDYLKSIRTILVAATLLQLICFVGYWIGTYVIYQFCTITWDTLITSAVMLMVVRFGESYIVLVTENYTLQNHSEIPFKFTITIFLIWFIGSCINIIGYLFAFVSICRHPKNIHNKISSSCFVAWTISCLLILSIGMYILTRIERRFKRILQDKLEYKDDRKQSRLKKHLLKQQNNQITQNKKMVPKLTLTSQTINENHADEQKYDTRSFNTYSKLPTHTTETTYSKKMNASALSTTIGSVNDSVMTQRGIIMKSELKRMRILIYGLLFLICIFLFNGVHQVYQLLKSLDTYDKISWLNKLSWLDDFSVDDPEHVKRWVVTYLIYTKWTIMNVFVMCFSWIPRSRMLDEWSN
eukprot:227851_1